jgi:CRISPR-associated protein Cst2
VLPNVIERDFGHFSRNLKPGEDIIPFESEHYTTCLQGVFTLSLADVGHFIVGEMRDLSEEILKAHGLEVSTSVYQMPKEECIKRAQQTIQALARLRGGAHLARNLSDVTPVVVLVGFLDGGNAPFQRLFEPDENNERVRLNLTRLSSVLNDYKDRLLAPEDGKALYFGYRPTVLTDEAEALKALTNEDPFKGCIEVAGTPQQALEKAAGAVAMVL